MLESTTKVQIHDKLTPVHKTSSMASKVILLSLSLDPCDANLSKAFDTVLGLMEIHPNLGNPTHPDEISVKRIMFTLKTRYFSCNKP